MSTPEIFATPRHVTNLPDCYFYHTMEVPGYGLQRGEWDLRPGVADYLGRVDLRGQRVLEIGTANGFLCFHMEAAGAAVVAFDLSAEQQWDIVPYAGSDVTALVATYQQHIHRLNNAYWLTHRVLQSRAQVVYGTVYAIPERIGAVDVAVFGSVLLHVRDPFLALQNALRLTRGTVIVTDRARFDDPSRWRRLLGLAPARVERRAMGFLPDARTQHPNETWWDLPPAVIRQFLGVLGFEETTISYHQQLYKEHPLDLYTIVGRRTRGAAIL